MQLGNCRGTIMYRGEVTLVFKMGKVIPEASIKIWLEAITMPEMQSNSTSPWLML